MPLERGRFVVNHQGIKKCITTNNLFLTEKQSIPWVISESVSGNRNDLFDIENSFQKILDDLKFVEILTQRLFMNAIQDMTLLGLNTFIYI